MDLVVRTYIVDSMEVVKIIIFGQTIIDKNMVPVITKLAIMDFKVIGQTNGVEIIKVLMTKNLTYLFIAVFKVKGRVGFLVHYTAILFFRELAAKMTQRIFKN